MSKRLRSSFRPRKARSLKPRTGRPSSPTPAITEGVEAALAAAALEHGESAETEPNDAAPVEAAPVDPAPQAEPAADPAPAIVAEACAAETPAAETGAAAEPTAAAPPMEAIADEPALPERTTLPEVLRADVEEVSTRTTEPSIDVRPPPASAASETRPEEPVVEAPKSAKKAQAQAAPPSKNEARSPKSARDAHEHHDHEDDPSATSLSLSADFFRMEEESVPPLVEGEDHDDVLRAPPPSAQTVARRARFRRVVGAIIGIAGILSIAVVGKAVASRSTRASLPPPPRTEAPAKAAAATLEAPKPVAAAPAEAPKPAPAEEAKAADEAKPAPSEEPKAAPAPADEAKAAPAEEAKAAPSAEPKAAEPAAEALSEADIKKLKKEAESLLNRGKRAEAIEAAKKAIAADPADALPYLLMGSALQDSGKWKDGIEAYSECVRHATKGPIHECRAMGGKK